jgi:sugar (pentulose or hexulose) kinase
MKEAYIAIDSGTSSIRAGLFDRDLRTVDLKSIRRITPKEIDVDAEWEDIKSLLRSLSADNRGYEARGVSVTHFLSWVPVDGGMRPLTQALSYADQREEELARLLAKIDPGELYDRTGRRATPELGGLKLMACLRQDPGLYERTKRYLSVKDYINFRLTGEVATDYTYACYSLLLNQQTMDWDAEIAGAMGIGLEKMPPLKNGNEIIGTVCPKVAEECLLPEGIPVVAGGPDGSLGVLGASGVAPRLATSILGTTDVLFTVTEHKSEGPDRGLVRNIAPLPGYWMSGGPLGYAGGAVDWFIEKLLQCSATAESLCTKAAGVEAGTTGVFFLTSLTGERTPYWNSSMRGSIVGLDPSHGREHVVRAAMEANAFVNRNIIERMRDSGLEISELAAVGGGSRNAAWMQIKADVLGMPVRVLGEKESTLRGAAVLLATLSGNAADIPEAQTAHVYLPDAARREACESAYAQYMSLVESLDSYYGAVADRKGLK